MGDRSLKIGTLVPPLYGFCIVLHLSAAKGLVIFLLRISLFGSFLCLGSQINDCIILICFSFGRFYCLAGFLILSRSTICNRSRTWVSWSLVVFTTDRFMFLFL